MMEAFSLVRARASDRPDIERLHSLAAAADGHPSFGEVVPRDLDRPAPDSIGLIARARADDDRGRLLVSGSADAVAYVHVARADTLASRHWTISFAIRPDRRADALIRSLIDAAVDHVASHGGGRAALWVLGGESAYGSALAAASFEHDRDLLQMKVDLPTSAAVSWPAGAVARSFEEGRDEVAWLEVNNRAFGSHPEQGGWTEETLRRRMAEPWFDPFLFLLAFDASGLAGFNWCRAHGPEGNDPPTGEIFAIGVDPRARGTGLGRALAVAGLERLASRGLRTGMLFVDAANSAARALYESLGFTVRRLDRAYRREVPGS